MNNEVKKYYLKEFSYYDGECFITFSIVSIDFERRTINVAITNREKISVIEYDLLKDDNGNFYFEYGCEITPIEVNDFETIND